MNQEQHITSSLGRDVLAAYSPTGERCPAVESLPPPGHLPFDQYGRYQMMREALDAVRPILGAHLHVLDVGGFYRTGRGQEVLPAQLFLPRDEVVVVDQGPCALPGYMRGDGRNLTFADQSFDFVISCDTLEHVPSADRAAFWSELLRVARYGVLLAAPFASPEVVAAEALLFDYIKAELGVEQIQLKEHVTYGLPDLSATCRLLEERGLPHRVYPSGYVHAWLFMMVAKHYLFGRTHDYALHEQVDAYYTRFFATSERSEPAYRHLLLVAQADQIDWLAAADAAIAPTIKPEQEAAANWPQLPAWLFQLVGLQLEERRLQPLIHTVTAQAQTIQALQQSLVQREAQVQDLEQRSHWLADQLDATRRLLDAVQNGRVMRVMNWLTRRRGE